MIIDLRKRTRCVNKKIVVEMEVVRECDCDRVFNLSGILCIIMYIANSNTTHNYPINFKNECLFFTCFNPCLITL